MLRYYRLLVVSVVMAIFFFVVGATEYVFEASNLAKELAPLIGVDENPLREHLTRILGDNWIKHEIVYCRPLAVSGLLLFVAHGVDSQVPQRAWKCASNLISTNVIETRSRWLSAAFQTRIWIATQRTQRGR